MNLNAPRSYELRNYSPLLNGLEKLQLYVILLIIAAAITHASWNAIAKVSKNILALMWWSTVFGVLGYGVWLAAGPGIYLSPSSRIPFLVSAICETGYFVTLVKGYSQGDLSLVYPISRGSAPIFAALLGATVLAENLPLVGYLGIFLMVVGVYVASQPVEQSKIRFGFSSIVGDRAVAWSLACGVFIAIYSVTDKVAVVATNPLVYNWWVFAGNSVLWAPFVWRRSHFNANFDELRKNWLRMIIVGVLSLGAYALALAALALTSASYVVAGRGLSVVIGACIGSFMLKERFGTARITGATLMVAGLALIAFS
jgi:drug/metabolite transporter (DMT)-like permease